MKKTLRYLTLATTLCLLLCSCSRNQPNDNPDSPSVPTDSFSTSGNAINPESNTNSDAQNYDEMYRNLSRELSHELYCELYEQLYNDITTEIFVTNYTTPQNHSKIDRTLDCEQIMLDRAETLKNMISNYYNSDVTKLAFKTSGLKSVKYFSEFMREVLSDEFSSYSEFKELFNDSVYDDYIDYINYSCGGFKEIQGEFYFSSWVNGGRRGTGETWYLDYDIEDDRIIGHFAEFVYDVSQQEKPTAEQLNDENNYNFYDIIIQNIDGNYVITEITSPNSYYYYEIHGMCYNNGYVDRSLITNPKVKPKYPIA